ncbi:hypothetical protein LguiA_003383 [Lonicera macranthoides]
MANGVEKVKFFSNNPGVLDAFMWSNISIMISCPNGEIKLIDEEEKAKAWVKENVTDLVSNGLKITHVCIAHEPYLKANASSYIPDENDETTYVAAIIKALESVAKALEGQNPKNNVKASIPFSTEVLKPDIVKPSEGDFREEMKDNMTQILHTLNCSGSPFMVNLYPHFHIREKGYPLEFAYFKEANTNFTIKDGQNVYTNVFDATFDTFVSAIRRNGFPNMEIIAQVGWPTDGDIHASIPIAKTFYRGLLKKLSSNRGTPLYPSPLDVYIYSLVDENSRPQQPRGYSERHYGIYWYDGTPKYEYEFNPFRVNKSLERVQGISKMPQRWCVLKNNSKIDDQLHNKLFNFACQKADCSRLMYGGSCNQVLDRNGNLSYAFNMYFQTQSQNLIGGACKFENYGVVVDEDPSVATCKFPLQILSTIMVGGQAEMATTLVTNGGRINIMDFKLLPFSLSTTNEDDDSNDVVLQTVHYYPLLPLYNLHHI